MDRNGGTATLTKHTRMPRASHRPASKPAQQSKEGHDRIARRSRPTASYAATCGSVAAAARTSSSAAMSCSEMPVPAATSAASGMETTGGVPLTAGDGIGCCCPSLATKTARAGLLVVAAGVDVRDVGSPMLWVRSRFVGVPPASLPRPDCCTIFEPKGGGRTLIWTSPCALAFGMTLVLPPLVEEGRPTAPFGVPEMPSVSRTSHVGAEPCQSIMTPMRGESLR